MFTITWQLEQKFILKIIVKEIGEKRGSEILEERNLDEGLMNWTWIVNEIWLSIYCYYKNRADKVYFYFFKGILKAFYLGAVWGGGEDVMEWSTILEEKEEGSNIHDFFFFLFKI